MGKNRSLEQAPATLYSLDINSI